MKAYVVPFLMMAVFGGWCASVFGITNYVSLASTNPVSPYTSWATAATNIQDAIAVCTTGDVVLVTNGVYALGGATASGATTRAALSSGISMYSVNGAAATIIDGRGTCRGAFVSSNSFLVGFTVSNGYVGNSVRGAGIYLMGGGTVSNCIVENNWDDEPGGALVPGGGGIYLDKGGLVDHCVIRNNVSDNSGGGVAFFTGGIMQNCVLYGNSGYYGGGAFADRDCTLIHCTLADNTANAAGGGLAVNQPRYNTLVNNVMYGNTGGEWSVPFGSFTSGITNNCTTPAMGANCVTAAPQYADPTNDNYHMIRTSSCVDAGFAMITVSNDLDGNIRPMDGNLDGLTAWDIGAYELGPMPVIAITNAPALVAYQNTGAYLAGTANQFVGGMLWWSNATTAAEMSFGPLQGPTNWSIASLPVTNGDNMVIVTCSNAWGAVTSATVSIHRETYSEAVPHIATNALIFPAVGSILAVGELTNIVWNPAGISDSVDGTNLVIAAMTIHVAATSNIAATVSNDVANLAGVCPWPVPITLIDTTYVVRFDVVDSSGLTSTMTFANNAFTIVPEPATCLSVLLICVMARWSLRRGTA